jgi:hypothetical protein
MQSSSKRPHPSKAEAASSHNDTCTAKMQNTRRTVRRGHGQGSVVRIAAMTSDAALHHEDGVGAVTQTSLAMGQSLRGRGMSDRIHRRIHRINSNVYAARGEGGDGMFTRRNVKRGDILCSYTGTQVPEDAADPHNTQYLMHMLVAATATA